MASADASRGTTITSSTTAARTPSAIPCARRDRGVSLCFRRGMDRKGRVKYRNSPRMVSRKLSPTAAIVSHGAVRPVRANRPISTRAMEITAFSRFSHHTL